MPTQYLRVYTYLSVRLLSECCQRSRKRLSRNVVGLHPGCGFRQCRSRHCFINRCSPKTALQMQNFLSDCLRAASLSLCPTSCSFPTLGHAANARLLHYLLLEPTHGGCRISQKKCMNDEKSSSATTQPRESTATQGVMRVTIAS